VSVRVVDFESSNEDNLAPAFTDESLALRFSDEHARDLRYVAAWSKWLIWKETHWQFDETLYAFDLARKICRSAALECDKPNDSRIISSAKTVAAVERLAKADRRHASTADQWDANPWLINTPGGVVDLRTGQIRSAQPSNYITKITAVAPDFGCPIPIWEEFLQRVTGNNPQLIEFLQRVAGYCLTGSTREQAMFFLYGTGANGKTVFINTISGILDDYQQTAPMETFIESHLDRHPTDLASLRGARMVAATETEEGRRWAESRIKALTGGDKIAARFMRQDFFEFIPQFKLLIAGNHKPRLRAVDEAIRRRFNLVPFTLTIPAEERDKDLAEKLKAEWPGIFAWMIDGSLEWQRVGLNPPDIVIAATDEYMKAQDTVSEWIDERIVRDPSAWTSRSDLFNDWTEYAMKAGEHVGTRQRFVEAIEAKGLEPRNRNTGRGFCVRLKPTACSYDR
jgi:putative DNA primase/helicase